MATKKMTFAETVTKEAVKIGINSTNGAFYFPKGHKVVPSIDSSGSIIGDFPTIAKSFSNVQQFLSMNQQTLTVTFKAMLEENEDLAIRFALYLRDARQGAGLRTASRFIFEILSNHPNIAQIIEKIPVLGRFDDLLINWKSEATMLLAVARYIKGLNDPSECGLAAKWAPRQKSIWAYRLRRDMGMTEKQWRKFLVSKTQVVEQKMCAKDWTGINYSHVPSKAHSIYRKAFIRHNEQGYSRYVASLKNGDEGVKINAAGIEPHELVSKMSIIFGQSYRDSLDAQFAAIPYDASVLKIFPIVDVSPSMDKKATWTLSAKSIAISLGLYIAQNQKGGLKNKVMTFSEKPVIVDLGTNSPTVSVDILQRSDWGRYTDLVQSMKVLFQICKENRVPQEDLPDVMIIFTDMEYNGTTSGIKGKTEIDHIRAAAAHYGYSKIPKIVFWNLSMTTDEVPQALKANDELVTLVSGFSTKILKNLSTILEKDSFSFESSFIETLMNERYSYGSAL